MGHACSAFFPHRKSVGSKFFIVDVALGKANEAKENPRDAGSEPPIALVVGSLKTCTTTKSTGGRGFFPYFELSNTALLNNCSAC